METRNALMLMLCAFALFVLSRQREPDRWDAATIAVVIALLIFGDGGVG